jgi:GT2 family glycosyltransferase
VKLFDFSLPRDDICRERELYYRIVPLDNGEFDHDTRILKIPKNSTILFDTYFNCFSYSKYLKYTIISKVTAVLSIKGYAKVRLMSVYIQANGGVARDILMEREIHTLDFQKVGLEYDFSDDNTQGYFYIEIASLTEDIYFSSGHWEASDIYMPKRVKIAAIICTYKRETFIFRNMAIVDRDIFGANSTDDIGNYITFFIVDNGKTLLEDQWNKEHIKVFPNKNYGGSGGFTRGIIEACRHKDVYTHFLLMDDDIIFDAGTLVKTIHFLQILRPEHLDLCIGGAMLRLDMPFIQHEAGALWLGIKQKSIKHDLDLRRWDAVLQNEVEEMRIDYQAWWYLCVPLSAVDTHGLPLPLFISGDDIEYSLRAIKNVLIINGIGVWHQYFDYKYNMTLAYYVSRNHFVINALHPAEKNGPFHECLYLLYFIIKHLVQQRYIAAEFVLRSGIDFLKGPDFFLGINEEKLNQELVSRIPRKYSDAELNKMGLPFVLNKYNPPTKLSELDNIIMIFIFIGICIFPEFLYKRDYQIVDAVKAGVIAFFRVKRVLHYNIYESCGFITEISKKKLWTIGFRGLGLLVKMIFLYSKVSRLYRERIKELTSVDFWCKHLNIDPIKL